MTRTEKKDLERNFVVAFLQTIGNSSLLNTTDREEPDFLLIDSPLIGIEVSQLFSEPKLGEVSRINIEGGWDGVMELALKMWTDSGKPKVDVRIMFNEKIHIRKTEKVIFAKAITTLIDQCLPNPGESFWSSEVLLTLPLGVVELIIHREVDLELPSWRFIDAAWTPQLTSELIQNCISKKEGKRSTYLENCDKIWLLIVLYGRRPSGNFNIPELFVKERYEFKFDKVYLFNAFPPKTWELQNIGICI